MKFAPKTISAVLFRVLLFASGCAILCPAGRAAPLAKGQLLPELRLKNGTTLHEVTVVAVGSTTVIAKWTGGQGSIRLALLPDELRAGLAPAAPERAAAPVPPPTAGPAGTGSQVPSVEIPTEIKLTNGFVMHQSRVVRWQPEGVLVDYQGGTVLVLFINISPEQRAIFSARKDEALTQQAKADSRSASAQDTSVRDSEAQKAEEARAREQAEAKAEEIKNGMSSHYLVKGMTKEQVKESFGVPPDDKGDTFFYLARGHDKYGNSADRTLIFKDGVLMGWRDMRDGEPNGAVEH